MCGVWGKLKVIRLVSSLEHPDDRWPLTHSIRIPIIPTNISIRVVSYAIGPLHSNHDPRMPSARLLLTKNSHVVKRAARPMLALARPFHSPFTVLGNSPLRSPPSPNVTYEKQLEHSSELLSGTRTYVVSEQDASHKFYEVPSGAYPISAPYANFARTDIHTRVRLTGAFDFCAWPDHLYSPRKECCDSV